MILSRTSAPIGAAKIIPVSNAPVVRNHRWPQKAPTLRSIGAVVLSENGQVYQSVNALSGFNPGPGRRQLARGI